MSALADSTYRSLVGRLQRGGTTVLFLSRPVPPRMVWSCRVRNESSPEDTGIDVEVGGKVYRNQDASYVEVQGHRFDPVSGNCPALDQVESVIRTALAVKDAQSQPKPVETSSTQSEHAVEIPPEPERAEPAPAFTPAVLRKKDKSRRRNRTRQVGETGDEAAVAASEVCGGSEADGQPESKVETPG